MGQISHDIKGMNIPKKKYFAAIESLGYNVVQTYYEASLIKTDCPIPVLYAIQKKWKQLEIEKEGKGRDIYHKLGTGYGR